LNGPDIELGKPTELRLLFPDFAFFLVASHGAYVVAKSQQAFRFSFWNLFSR